MPIDWPFKHIFIISIRKQRLRACLKRLGLLCRYVTIIPACNGEGIDKHKWIADGSVSTTSVLRRGELGCFESHCRVWRYIVEQHITDALILEDDVRLEPSKQLFSHVIAALADDVQWDLLFFGRSYVKRDNRERLTPHLVVSGAFFGLFAYAITETAARKLLKHRMVKTFDIPVDIVISDLGLNGYLRILACVPEVCNIVNDSTSDTFNII